MITEYVKGKPYFSDTAEKIQQYAYLDKNITTDVLIVGGGIDGAITAYYFARAGLDVTIIDKHRFGYMNTSCATALLEYQLDDHAKDLGKYFTGEDAVNIYRLGLDALADIDSIINELGNHCHYSKRDTLIYSLNKGDEKELLPEYELRKTSGLDVEYISRANNPFPFPVEAGIYAHGGGAEFNPYLFTKQMLDGAKSYGARLFEHTEATEIINQRSGHKVITNYGIEIKCSKLVCSTGYNTRLFTSKRLCEKFISYTIVTNPLAGIEWKKRCLLQDNSHPYHYIRLSPDNRLIVGGEDIPFANSTIADKKAQKKYQLLLDYAKLLFPEFADKMKIDYQFCGAFSATGNNLAVIGRDDQSGILYNLGYGANGIVYSVYGVQMLLGLLNKKTDPLAHFFAPNRNLPN